ncbi:probable enoyl-CoA hydratase isoform X2 [Eriocheir sinensis]|uniref:probable enoyl-CoA hydratase isoform X2 n=1 Tax=Eriocheir sinensis TaxID=95602 RepID=UPI0021CADCD0|nr:probable enoyl-CoA hydratase isoform X2 [Eriocheir sinensis]XP_050689743.1 probable enoyl-CoA hydratase isoform X2 [Eriocheir sinensis]XP_050689803.1 probable enoyl-CoA hydratase isoform X2 [Eriocheir sinensis]XP_050689902.1 probable enoyl-CoA hydratase isoform X2 [Eriocheir sinensis]XP_050689952.1 probable enoyl-CoA hydratase isoform X2 [Eriocheir sinensis]XP_050689970.1 probable enoyl-CoA hydratase isoform X2 [Eriocheir sinensis]XP_050690040.1 probable enoyl-CoA hydratase isoform X2 [Eri
MSVGLQSSLRTFFSLGRRLRCAQVFSTEANTTIADEGTVKVENYDGVTLIGINRPEKRNCVNTPTAEALLKAFQEFDSDNSAKVAVLYGVGGNFCAGYDLKEIGEDVPAHLGSYGRGPMGPSRFETKKPVIAAVEGFAVAGGLELALWCDLRIVEETAVMGVYCRRFGVPLIDGGTVRLPAIVGLGRALDLILTGRAIKGKEALEWGLANRLVACGTAIGQAVKLASELIKFPQQCMLADRASAYNAVFNARSLQEALQFEHENGCPVILQESVEGARKFVEGVGRHGKFNLHTKVDPKDLNKSKL